MVLLAYFWHAYSVYQSWVVLYRQLFQLLSWLPTRRWFTPKEAQIEKQAVEHESMAHFLQACLVLRLKHYITFRYHANGCGGVTANLGKFSPFKQFEKVFSCERNLLYGTMQIQAAKPE